MDLNKSSDTSKSTSTAQLYQAPTAVLSQSSNLQMMPNETTWYHFYGRIGRLRYLSYQLFIMLSFYLLMGALVFLFGLITQANGSGDNSITTVVLSIIFMPLYIIMAIYSIIIYPKRRLNDLGRSGWLALTMFLPFINIIFILYILFAQGDEGVNQYGTPPRKNSIIHYIAGWIAPFLFLVFIIAILAAMILPY
ncbi:DUF805 domain-containing protein [Psychrobacter sp. I-STPA10]|uniref:DUF805 domain-containing protein n=1 Tax=Psychrobacter sp. I-STPA10 TaxID=2585769 RepID=UPI001E4B4E0C|nr:DUF805 domain-containing protein [Psychrobacter sp. I-STPA10]